MRMKTLRLVVTFHTTAEAMATEQLCKAAGLPGCMISAPRSVTADCGIAWSAPVESRGELERQLSEAGIETAGLYELMVW